MSNSIAESPDTLDLRPAAELPPVVDAALAALLPAATEQYDRLVDSASAVVGSSVDWWASVPASRNTYVSRIFEACYQLSLLCLLESQGRLPAVIVTDWAVFGRILAQRFGPTVKITIKPVSDSEGRTGSNRFRAIAALLRQLWRRHRAAGRHRRHAAVEPGCVLLESFVIPSSFDRDGTFRDIFFSGLRDALPGDVQPRLHLVPQLSALPYPGGVYDRLFKDVRAVFLREWLLKPVDYAFALTHGLWRCSRLRLPRLTYSGADLRPLFIDEIRQHRFSEPVVQALLNFRFCQRLALGGFRPARLIDWFEGQSVDKCMMLGMRRFLPDVPTVGYLGFAPRAGYRCCYPTVGEWTAGVLPHRLAVSGQAFVERLKGNSPQDVAVAPSFRYGKLEAQHGRHASPGSLRLFVPLPARLRDAAVLLSMLGKAMPASYPWAVEIRAHPIHEPRQVLPILRDAGFDETALSDASFEIGLGRAGAVIGVGSNALLEAAAEGVPVVVALSGARSRLEDPLPPNLASPLIQRATSIAEMTEILLGLPALRIPRNEASRLRDLLFPPLDREHMTVFHT